MCIIICQEKFCHCASAILKLVTTEAAASFGGFHFWFLTYRYCIKPLCLSNPYFRAYKLSNPEIYFCTGVWKFLHRSLNIVLVNDISF